MSVKDPQDLDPQALAEACAAAMWRADASSPHLGMSLESVAPGRAAVSMTVADYMINGHGICHGGYVFTLADTAFAFAVNTVRQPSVGQNCVITYLQPARLGDRLIAEAVEIARPGRSGLCDVRVTNRDGAHIAEFRGHSRTVKGGPPLAADAAADNGD